MEDKLHQLHQNYIASNGGYHEIQRHPTIEPDNRGGKPYIRGMKIKVYDVLDYLASGITHQEILDDFPYLAEEDIMACLSYTTEREQYTMAVAV